MSSDIDMASNALILLGDNPISSFTESGFGATAASNLYSTTYRAILASHPWSFALKEQYLSRLSQTPDDETGFTYAYQMPTDLIRVWEVMDYGDYEIVGSLLYSNQSTLLMRYVYEIEETQLPPHVVEAIEYQLAAKFAPFVTEDAGLAGLYEQKALMALARAQTIDSQNRPQSGIVHSPFTDVRG